MRKLTKRGLSLVTVLAVAFVMCFGTMTTAFAADPQVVVNVNGEEKAIFSVADFQNGTDTAFDVTGITLDHLLAAVDVPDNSIIDIDTETEEYKGTTVDTFANFKDANCILYYRDDRGQIDAKYDNTKACTDQGGSQKKVCAINITIPEPTVAPGQVKGVKVAKAKKGAVKVSWTPLKNDVTGYEISQTTAKGKTKVVKTVNNPKTKKVTIKAKKGKKCFYKIRATYNIGSINAKGKWSKVVSFKLK